MAERKIVSRPDFVRAYNSSNSVAEVSQKTGLAEATITQRASKLKTEGALLKSFPRKASGNRGMSIAELNALLEQEGLLPTDELVEA